MFSLLAVIILLSASAHTYNTRHDPHVGFANTKSRYFGHGTWFAPGQGACGSVATGNDYIVAVNKPQYHNGHRCYKHIRITNTKNGKSVGAQIQDECPDCAYGSLDMSPAVFVAIADSGLSEGEISISWSFAGSSKRASESNDPTSGVLTVNTTITSEFLGPALVSAGESVAANSDLSPL